MQTPVAGASRLKRQAAAALRGVDQFVERYPLPIMGAILLIYIGRALFFSHTTELQIDELLTYADVRIPSLSDLWWTLKNYPPALDPPLHPVLAFLAFRLPIPFPLSFRLPSIIGYGAMMVSIFVLLRKRAPAAVTLTASAVPMLIPAFEFAVQARPYALVLGFSGSAFAFWQAATEQGRRRAGALAGMCLCLVGVLLTHFLGVLAFVPLVLGELWRSARRGIDPAIWIVFAMSATAMLVYVPLLPAASLYRVNPWHGVYIDDLWQTYLLGVEPVLVMIVSLCALLWPVFRRAYSAEKAIMLPQHECVAITGFYLVPVISFLIAVFATHSYVARYALMFGIAEAIAVAILIYSLTNRAWSGVIMLVLVITASQPALQFLYDKPGQNTSGISASATLPDLDRMPALPVVEPSWHDYMRLALLGPDNLRKRLVLVLDPEDVKQKTNFALSTEAVQRALNLPKESYEALIQSHPQFLLLEGSRLREQLLQDGREVRLVGRVFQRDLYLVTRTQKD